MKDLARMQSMINELVMLANKASLYSRRSCDYIEQLSDVNYAVLKKSWRKADKNVYPSFSAYINKLIKGKLKPCESYL